MNCYVCDAEGKVTAAVATCHHCGVGMCRTHFEQDAHAPRPRGMVRSACAHYPRVKCSGSRSRRRARAAGAGLKPVCVGRDRCYGRRQGDEARRHLTAAACAMASTEGPRRQTSTGRSYART